MDDETLQKATPRPWRTDGRFKIATHERAIATIQVEYPRYGSPAREQIESEDLANAALIVAAVNQYEALRAVSDAVTLALFAYDAQTNTAMSVRFKAAMSDLRAKLAEVERG